MTNSRIAQTGDIFIDRAATFSLAIKARDEAGAWIDLSSTTVVFDFHHGEPIELADHPDDSRFKLLVIEPADAAAMTFRRSAYRLSFIDGADAGEIVGGNLFVDGETIEGGASGSLHVVGFELIYDPLGAITIDAITTGGTVTPPPPPPPPPPPSITLGTLSLGQTNFTVGTSASGAITGATSGSTITATGLPTGFTLNSAARTWSYSGAGSAASFSVGLVETLTGALNTPKTTTLTLNIAAQPSTGGTGALDFSNAANSQLVAAIL